MARNYPHWAGTLSGVLENLLHHNTDYDQFRAEHLLQQFKDGYNQPEYGEIHAAWDAQQEAENDD